MDAPEVHPLDAEFVHTMVSCHVPEWIQDHLKHQGFHSADLFRFAFVDSDALESFIQKLLQPSDGDDAWKSSPQAASVRLLHHRISDRQYVSEVTAPPEGSEPVESNQLLQLAWAELPPKRVRDSEFVRLKKEFSHKYPSELLTTSSTPCVRLLSTILQQKERNCYQWLPWRELLSESKAIDLSERGRKRQRIEGLLVFDTALEVEDSDVSAAPWALATMFEVRRNAFALAQVCHLAAMKSYDQAFMKLYTAKPSDGLRPPNMKEAQQADRDLWSTIFRLCNEKSWDMENAIIEVVETRNLMDVHMMARPRAIQPLPHPKGKGQHKDKGPSKGKSKGTDQKAPSTPWPSSWAASHGDKKFCLRFHTSARCSYGAGCKFSHDCPVLVGSKPCLKNHAARDHAQPFQPKN